MKGHAYGITLSSRLWERTTPGPPEERTYCWSYLPPDTPLEALAGYAHRRHAIEQFHEETKGELGWDQYQGRLWLGFHRQAVTVMLAYSVLVWLEQQQRRRDKQQGRRRDLFPPRPQHPRRSRPAVQRAVARWLRHQAVLWWVTTDRFIELHSSRI